MPIVSIVSLFLQFLVPNYESQIQTPLAGAIPLFLSAFWSWSLLIGAISGMPRETHSLMATIASYR